MPEESSEQIAPEKINEELINQKLFEMQNQAMQQGAVNTAAYGAPLKQESALIQWQLDCQVLLNDIERRLKRLTYDQETDSYIRVGNLKPLIPDEAVDLILFTLSPILNHNTLLSLMRSKTIEQIVNSTIDDIDYYLTENAQSFGLKNRTYINMIINPIHTMTFALFNRSIEFKTLNTLSKNYTVNENTSSLGVNNAKNSGLFGNLPFLGTNRS